MIKTTAILSLMLITILVPFIYGQESLPLRVAAISMWSDTNVVFNLSRIDSFASLAAMDSAKLVVFPEACLQQNPGWGYITHIPTAAEIDYLHRTAETIPGPSTVALEGIATRLNIVLILGMTEVDSAGEHYYNTAVVVGPEGYIGKYRKVNLWDALSLGNEHLCWEPGDRGYAAFDTPIGKIGILICADMRIDEAIDSVVAFGAEMIAAISGWPVEARPAYMTTTENVAVRSDMPVAVGPQVGEAPNATFGGIARVLDAEGNSLSETPADSEGIACATVNLTTGIHEFCFHKPYALGVKAYPNPFNSAVTFEFFSVSYEVTVEYNPPPQIEVFDMNGRKIAGFGILGSPVYRIPGSPLCSWQPDRSLSSGVYLVRVHNGDYTASCKVLYLK